MSKRVKGSEIKPTFETLSLWISRPSNWAFTNFSVTHGLTLSISSTRISGAAKVCTLVHDACLIIKTFGVVITVSNFGCI